MAERQEGNLVVLGAGYAGLTVAKEVDRLSRGTVRIVLVDRHPVHVLRTELYEVGRLAQDPGTVAPWTVPLARVLERSTVEVKQGTVESIDVSARTVRLDTGELPFGLLAICLGSVAAYYGVPGAREFTHSVYRLSEAKRTALAIRDIEAASPHLVGERRPRVIVIGGGSTGTELAAEIATTDWAAITDRPARPPDVILLTGSLPFLAGFPPKLIDHARALLKRAGVQVIHGLNVTQVEPGRVHTEDGSVFASDAAVWCAGLEAPPVVRDLPVPHGKGGRLAVEPTLEIPGHSGLFAVGDVVESRDPTTGMLVPATAQAALAEARTAASNLVARGRGEPLAPFSYRERGVVVAVGLGKGAGSLRHVTLWGSPAALLKRLVQREYARSVTRGEGSRLL